MPRSSFTWGSEMTGIMKIIRRVLFVVFVCVLFAAVSEVFIHKGIQGAPIRDFFANRDDEHYDVLAFGPSYMFFTFNPVELYRNYGLLSFVPGTSCQPIEVTYHYIKKALEIYKPKVVIVGASMFVLSEGQYLLSDGNAHTAVDCFPRGIERARLVFDLNVQSQYENFLFPLIKYHQRWKNLKKGDFTGVPMSANSDKEKMRLAIRGHLAYFDSTQTGCIQAIDMAKEKRKPVFEDYLRWLDKISELVSSHGANLLLLQAPRRGALCDGRLATLQDYASARGIPLLNLVEEFDKTSIDNAMDFYDTGHLNCFGAEKATRYIGKYLMDHYGFTTNHSESVRARWNADCKRYDEAKAAAFAAKKK